MAAAADLPADVVTETVHEPVAKPQVLGRLTLIEVSDQLFSVEAQKPPLPSVRQVPLAFH